MAAGVNPARSPDEDCVVSLYETAGALGVHDLDLLDDGNRNGKET
jgi:hypothetical protein